MDSVWLKKLFSRRDVKELCPKIDIREEADEVEIYIELPGVEESEIDIEIKKNKIYVGATRRLVVRFDKKSYFYSERKFNSFYREIALPKKIDSEQMIKSYEDGILKIVLRKV